jgi:hypothetical protein
MCSVHITDSERNILSSLYKISFVILSIIYEKKNTFLRFGYGEQVTFFSFQTSIF